MTPQEIFNHVATHLFTQGKRAAGATGMCYYRAADGAKCAVGCLMPDEDYRVEFEGNTLSQLIAEGAWIPPAWMDKHTMEGNEGYKVALALQRVHDTLLNWRTTITMAVALREAAKHHNLDASIVDTLSFKDR